MRNLTFAKALLIVGLAMGASTLIPKPTRADSLDVSLQLPASAAAGSTGTFEVVLTDTSGSGVTIGGFDFELDTSSVDVALTDATTSTTGTYIFAGNSFDNDYLGGDQTVGTSPLLANDVAESGGTTLNSGESVDLGTVTFDVSSTAPTEDVGIDFIPLFTDLSDPNGNAISIDALDSGVLSIEGASTSVPEPSPLAMLLAGIAALGFIRLRAQTSRKQLRRQGLSESISPSLL